MYSDSFFLTSLFFSDSKKREDYPIKDLEIFEETKRFLDEYFKGANPKSFPKYHLEGISIFQSIVLEETCNIEYGEILTYGELAKKVAKRMNREYMSPQAIGHALNKNPICLIIPCHRVIGKITNLLVMLGE